MNKSTVYYLGLHVRHEPTQAWYWVLRGTVGILTVFNNVLVVVVIATRRKLRHEKSNWFVLSLSVADLFVGLVITSLQISGAVHSLTSPEIRFVVYDFLIDASILSLCTLTLDRYRAIVKPLRYLTYMTQYRATVLIIASWGIPFLVGLLRIVMLASGMKTEKEREKMFVVIQTLFFIVLPCITLTVSYIRILLIVRRHSNSEKKQKAQVDYNYSTDSNLHSTDDESDRPKTSSSTDGTSSSGKVSVFHGKRRWIEAIQEDEVSESTAGRILAGILAPIGDKSSLPAIGVVIVLYDSFWGCGVYAYFCDSFLPVHMRIEQDLKHIFGLLVLMNSALNPLVYAILKKDIRNEIKSVLHCGKGGDQYIVDSTIDVTQPVNKRNSVEEV